LKKSSSIERLFAEFSISFSKISLLLLVPEEVAKTSESKDTNTNKDEEEKR
jgi:hypothetical protein